MLLGLDLGTTNVKAVAVDAGGRVVADGCAPVQRFHTPDGGVEQDIEEIWDALVRAVRPVVAQLTIPLESARSASPARAEPCNCWVPDRSRWAV